MRNIWYEENLSFWCISIPMSLLSFSFLFFQTINKNQRSVKCSPITYPITDFKTNALQYRCCFPYNRKKLIPSETSRCMASICTFQVANYSSYHEYVYIFSQLFTEVIPIADFLIYTILMILHSFIDVTHLSKSNKFYRISLMHQTWNNNKPNMTKQDIF